MTDPTRADFLYTLPIQTRWNDNDVYGHVNNVVYYAYFDTVINRWLIGEGGLDPAKSEVIGLCVESQCRYVAPAAYPEELVAGLRVGKLGRSSVRYEIGIFRGDTLLAVGYFVHVFVDRETRRSTPIPEPIRHALARLVGVNP
jgi:acyl-CoA thioester hydrolase